MVRICFLGNLEDSPKFTFQEQYNQKYNNLVKPNNFQALEDDIFTFGDFSKGDIISMSIQVHLAEEKWSKLNHMVILSLRMKTLGEEGAQKKVHNESDAVYQY